MVHRYWSENSRRPMRNTGTTSLDRHPAAYSLGQAFSYCERMARQHYENFPVASLFLPRHLRPHVAAVYAFARTADDFADEGDHSDDERLEALADWRKKLDECYEQRADHPIFIALSEVVRVKHIPKQLLADLLTAFEMDVTTKRFASYEQVLFYCRHSANPVGRLVLHVFDDASERNCELSDNICTALQLANFWQDVLVDWDKGRLYVPLEDLARFGYTEEDFNRKVFDGRFQDLMKFQVQRTKDLFDAGKPLLHEVVQSLQFELWLTWNGGIKILKKIERVDFNIIGQRPKITVVDKISIVMKSFFHRSI
jgi:hydroxysqualene synthase